MATPSTIRELTCSIEPSVLTVDDESRVDSPSVMGPQISYPIVAFQEMGRTLTTDHFVAYGCLSPEVGYGTT